MRYNYKESRPSIFITHLVPFAFLFFTIHVPIRRHIDRAIDYGRQQFSRIHFILDHDDRQRRILLTFRILERIVHLGNANVGKSAPCSPNSNA